MTLELKQEVEMGLAKNNALVTIGNGYLYVRTKMPYTKHDEIRSLSITIPLNKLVESNDKNHKEFNPHGFDLIIK